MRGEISDTALASLLKNGGSLVRGPDLHAARILRIEGNLDQFVAGKPSNHTAHGGRLYLLGGREFAQRLRSAEDEHRKRREPRWTLTGCDVLLPDSAQQMDRGGVQTVGYRQDFGLPASAFGKRAPASGVCLNVSSRILFSFFRLTFPPEYS